MNIILLPYWHFCYWVKFIHLHVSTAEGAWNEKKTILYLDLWSLVQRTRESPIPAKPPSMAEIQGVSNLNGHSICLPSALEWKLQPLILSLKQKSTSAPSSRSSLLFHSNKHMPYANGIGGAVTRPSLINFIINMC